ncbi:hypothetical protein Glove_23g94 [Diversispora epigaea]|uniref:Sel1 repeat family protein n=1 Tax=Diversispora epigaea TaxID=1348612 RepID=A0A397JT74_9GLOM|nr:hypothetical protein Glove_23g94 [Diversispora epigaea]
MKDEPKDLATDSDSDNIQLDEAKLYKKAVDYHRSRKREEAFPIFYELALAGHKESLYYLGYYYEHGYIVPQDNKELSNITETVQLGQFKASIKLAEYNIPQPCLSNCNGLTGIIKRGLNHCQPAVRNDDILDDKKFLGITPQMLKNPETRQQHALRRAK